jgi:DNA-binding FadR family transcriptional regulator
MDPDRNSKGSYLPGGDRAFHVYIAEKAGNSVLIRLVAELFDACHSPQSLQIGKHFENVSTRRQAVAEHKAIVKALASRDPAAAKQAMQRHLHKAHNRLKKWIEDDI